MYERILVTLDMSELAEKALPHAIALMKAFSAELHLVSVVPVIEPESMHAAGISIDWQAQVEHAREYMKGVRKELMATGVEAEWDVCQGDVTEEILRYCRQQDCDLIVMSTHGRSGLGRWVYGSVADRVLRHAEVPVLLVRASEQE